MCLFFIILLFGPRLGLLFWWLIDRVRFDAVFDGFLLPLLGFIFVPWTTLMYVLVAPGGVSGFDWVWMALGLLADILSYSATAYGNRDKLSSTPTTETEVVETVEG